MHGLQNWRMTIIAGTSNYCINSKYIVVIYTGIFIIVSMPWLEYSLTGSVSSSDSAMNYSLVHDAMSKRVQVAGISFLNIWCTIIWR